MNGMELKVKRIVLGIKLQEVARVLNCSNAFVTYMENGKRHIPEDKHKVWVKFLESKNN